mmetsp:Transcript_27635/g.77528  ORF Transcript_27635/g.77528 Transcript_27635/m.77528 type:complete len:267 (-) Transcript_27635:162-962(-)
MKSCKAQDRELDVRRPPSSAGRERDPAQKLGQDRLGEVLVYPGPPSRGVPKLAGGGHPDVQRVARHEGAHASRHVRAQHLAGPIGDDLQRDLPLQAQGVLPLLLQGVRRHLEHLGLLHVACQRQLRGEKLAVAGDRVLGRDVRAVDGVQAHAGLHVRDAHRRGAATLRALDVAAVARLRQGCLQARHGPLRHLLAGEGGALRREVVKFPDVAADGVGVVHAQGPGPQAHGEGVVQRLRALPGHNAQAVALADVHETWAFSRSARSG